MLLILQQVARLVAAMLALYLVALGASLALVPRGEATGPLDSRTAGRSLYMTEPKYVFLSRPQLNTERDKVLFIGASNAQAGFRPSQVQGLVPHAEVHNLSVGGSNITQVAQIVDLVREVQSPEARRHNTYVIGLWYGLFAADSARWHTEDRHAGDTDIDIERYRYGFYRRTKTGPDPLLPPEHLGIGTTLIHPYLVLDRTARDLTRSLRGFLAAKPKAITDEDRNAVVLSQEERQKYLAFWREYMGGATSLEDGQFSTLLRTVDRIVADGGRVVLVDLPIPPWHANGSALAADYRERMVAVFDRLEGQPQVLAVRMDRDGQDDDFSDEVHPKPRVTERWAQRVALALATPAVPALSDGSALPQAASAR